MPINLDVKPPETVEATVDYLYGCLTAHEKGILRKQWGGLSGKLFTFGQAMIQQWGLERDESPLYRDCRDRFQLGNSDDVVALILNAVDARIQSNEFFRLEDGAQVLRSFWHQQRLDPAQRHRKLVEEGQRLFQENVKLEGGKARSLN